MLDQLVESKSSAAENKRRFGFLSTALFAVGFIFLAALTYSLFAKDLGEGDEVLELSSLVAPVPITNEKPPPSEVKSPPKTQTATANQSTQILRREMFESVDKAIKPPTEISSTKDVQSWVKDAKISEKDFTPPNYNPTPRENVNSGPGISAVNLPSEEATETQPPPKAETPKKIEPPKPEKPKTIVSDGVLNGKATNLVKPAYPPPAKAVRAGGAVNVQILIDEKGNVVSATAVSGHPLLRQAAEQAAKTSKFSPTYLSKVPVKVTGVIVYNFNVQ